MGFFLGVALTGLLVRLIALVLRKKEADLPGVNLLEGMIIPLVGLLVATMIMVPIFSEARRKAQERKHRLAFPSHAGAQSPNNRLRQSGKQP